MCTATRLAQNSHRTITSGGVASTSMVGVDVSPPSLHQRSVRQGYQHGCHFVGGKKHVSSEPTDRLLSKRGVRSCNARMCARRLVKRWSRADAF